MPPTWAACYENDVTAPRAFSDAEFRVAYM